MFYYVVLDGNNVVESHTASESFALPGNTQVVDLDTFLSLQNGGTRNNDGTFTPAPAPPARFISRLDFMRLFTRNERIAIRTAAANNSALADWYDLLQATETVDLEHPDVTAGLTALVNGNLLTADRKTAILANQQPA